MSSLWSLIEWTNDRMKAIIEMSDNKKEMKRKVKPCAFDVAFCCWAFSMSTVKSISSLSWLMMVAGTYVVVSSGSSVVFENGVIFKMVCTFEWIAHRKMRTIMYFTIQFTTFFGVKYRKTILRHTHTHEHTLTSYCPTVVFCVDISVGSTRIAGVPMVDSIFVAAAVVL